MRKNHKYQQYRKKYTRLCYQMHSLQDLSGKLTYTCWISKKMLWEKVEEGYRDEFLNNRKAPN